MGTWGEGPFDNDTAGDVIMALVAPLRIGTGPKRTELADQVQAAARYAIRASTMNGKETDFDPDAMVQNMIVGLLGKWTEDGR